MSTSQSEEKHPLLFFFVDKDHPEITRSNKRMAFDRRSDILSGARAVITQWPSQVATFGATIFMTIVAVFAVLLFVVALMSSNKLRIIPTCREDDYKLLDNNTVHLVHGPEHWKTNQLLLFQNIIQVFPKHKIHLIQVVYPTYSVTYRTKREPFVHKVVKRNVAEEISTPVINKRRNSKTLRLSAGPRSILDLLFLRKRRSTPYPTTIKTTTSEPLTLNKILSNHPNILLQNVTYEFIFRNTPLDYYWHHFSDNLKIFAIRVIQIWQYGGLSFDLYKTSEKSFNLNHTQNVFSYLKELDKQFNLSQYQHTVDALNELKNDEIDSLLSLGYTDFRTIPGAGVALAMDGSHMETKVACHSFFGHILGRLRRADMNTRVNETLKVTLAHFYRMHPMQSGY